MHFVHAAEEVVDVAHDVLVGAGEEDAEVVRIAVAQIVERKRFADVIEIDVLRDLAVGVAGDVDEGRLELRPLVEAMNRRDRKELPERPVIEQRLEDGEVADVLIGELVVERAQLLGDVARVHAGDEGLHPLRDLPEERLDARLHVEIEQAVLEHRLGLLLDLLQVVPCLVDAVLGQRTIDLQDLARQLVIGGANLPRLERRLLDRAERLHHEHRMVRDDGAARFRDDVRMRHLLVVADIHDVVDDVVRVLLERVVHRGVELRTRAVVVDGQSAADVEILERMPHLVELRVVHRRLAHGALDGEDVGDLRADVEVQQLERRLHLGLAQDLDRFENLGGRETELRMLAA